MKKLLNVAQLAFLIMLLPAWTQLGLNFRGTSTYVTDEANETYSVCDVDSVYPLTRAGATFGWITNTGDRQRDRNATVDRRLAGVCQVNNDGSQETFKVDLPSAGTYKICLALGDYEFDQGYSRIDILDDTTATFSVIDADGTLKGHFDDATGVDRTTAVWPGSNVCQTGVLFLSNTLVMKLGSNGPTQTGHSSIAHLYIELESGSTPTPTPTPTPPTPTPTPTPAVFALGLNFRLTSGYVTDGANETYVIGDVYPTTRAGSTFGWDSCFLNDCARNRDAGLDRRLAGQNQAVNDSGIPKVFTFDLPFTGNYKICLALGDGGGGGNQAYQKIEIFDDVTSKFAVTDVNGTAEAHFDDAVGTDFTAAAWPAGNVCQTGLNFTTTSLKVKLGATSVQTQSSTLAHMSIELEGGTPTPTPTPVVLPRLQAIGEE